MTQPTYLLLVLVSQLLACGLKPSSSPKQMAQSNAKSLEANADVITIEVALFDPTDLAAEVEDIADHMNAFHFKLLVEEGDCAGKETVGALSGDAPKTYTISISKNCSYTTELAYGYSAEIKEALSRNDASSQGGGGATPSDSPPTYLGQIKSMLDANCQSCHNDAFLPLNTFGAVAQNSGKILDRISRTAGQSGVMPPSKKLAQSEIDLFKAWQNAGAPQGQTNLLLTLENESAQMLDAVYYRSVSNTNQENLLSINKSISLRFLLQITAEGEALGLTSQMIQGEAYQRGLGWPGGLPKWAYNPASKLESPSKASEPDRSSDNSTDGTAGSADMPVPGSASNPGSKPLPDTTTTNPPSNQMPDPIPEASTPPPVTFDRVQALLLGPSKGGCDQCHAKYSSYSRLAADKNKINLHVVESTNMPKSPYKLNREERALIGQWISDGALPAK